MSSRERGMGNPFGEISVDVAGRIENGDDKKVEQVEAPAKVQVPEKIKEARARRTLEDERAERQQSVQDREQRRAQQIHDKRAELFQNVRVENNTPQQSIEDDFNKKFNKTASVQSILDQYETPALKQEAKERNAPYARAQRQAQRGNMSAVTLRNAGVKRNKIPEVIDNLIKDGIIEDVTGRTSLQRGYNSNTEVVPQNGNEIESQDLKINDASNEVIDADEIIPPNKNKVIIPSQIRAKAVTGKVLKEEKTSREIPKPVELKNFNKFETENEKQIFSNLKRKLEDSGRLTPEDLEAEGIGQINMIPLVIELEKKGFKIRSSKETLGAYELEPEPTEEPVKRAGVVSNPEAKKVQEPIRVEPEKIKVGNETVESAKVVERASQVEPSPEVVPPTNPAEQGVSVPQEATRQKTRAANPGRPKTFDDMPPSRGVFASIGRFLKEKTSNVVRPVSEFAKFQVERVKKYGEMVGANFLKNRRAVKFESEKAKFHIADEALKVTQEELDQVYEIKEAGGLSARQARKLERRRQELEKRVVKETGIRDQRLRKTQFQEGMVIKHENKKSLIAEQYAHVVNERLAPKAERFKELETVRDNVRSEINAWREFIRNQDERLQELKAEIANDKFVSPAKKAKLKALENKINNARNEVTERANRLLKNDARMVRVGAKLSKWQIKKDAYSRMAADKIEKFNGEMSEKPDRKVYREPNRPTTFDRSNPSILEFPEGGEAPQDDVDGEIESNEAPVTLPFKEWFKEWNALNKSKMEIKPEDIFEPNALAANTRANLQLTPAQFAGIVRRFVRSGKAAKIKSGDVEKMIVQTTDLVEGKQRSAARAA